MTTFIVGRQPETKTITVSYTDANAIASHLRKRALEMVGKLTVNVEEMEPAKASKIRTEIDRCWDWAHNFERMSHATITVWNGGK